MFFLFFGLWIVLNGRITVELILFGIPIAGLITLFLCKGMGYSLRADLLLVRNVHWILLYLLNLVWEIIKAAAAVMQVILDEEKDPDPVIVEFDSHLPSRYQNVLLANSITLTPGTYTLFLEGDHFVVHCLRKEFADGMDDSSFVRLLGRIK